MNRRKFLTRFLAAFAGLGFLFPACKKKGSPTQPNGSGDGTLPEKKILCACHGSTFDIRGNVLTGPATQPLSTVPAVLEGDRILLGDNARVIDLTLAENQSLRAVQGAKKFDLPGQALPVMVIRLSGSEVIALSSACTHEGCPVDLPA
ncbi:Rieske 2Fe-2S domain-containing protein [bacterium]|nr:Rieske 2Fe-2S domain-containing protein [bacterium]